MHVTRRVLVFACSAFPLLARAWSDHGQLDAFRELRPQLSPGASLVVPSDPLFADASMRWQAYLRPTYSAVVEVATEADVQAVVSLKS